MSGTVTPLADGAVSLKSVQTPSRTAREFAQQPLAY